MALTLGRKVSGKLKLMYTGNLEPIPVGLGESVLNKLYQIDMETKGVPNPYEVADTLITELNTKFGAKITYIEVRNSMVSVQLVGSPFVWGALLLFLPQILAGVGVIVGLISLYLVATGIPIWVYGLGAVAIVLILFGPSIAEAVTPPKERR